MRSVHSTLWILEALPYTYTLAHPAAYMADWRRAIITSKYEGRPEHREIKKADDRRDINAHRKALEKM